jgi:uncharacterized protein (TIGR02996 family)
MMHDDAFLQIILENPDDDAPRLIYADWLEERGDPRGEFIRVQCELARLPQRHPGRAALEAREAQLLAEHENAWLQALRPWVTSWRFQRGFVEQVAVTVEVCLDPTVCLPLLAPIREIGVDLTGAVISQHIVELVPESLARERVCFPLGLRNGQLLVAVSDPDDNNCWQALEFILNTNIGLIRAPAAQIVEAIDRDYGVQTLEPITCCFPDRIISGEGVDAVEEDPVITCPIVDSVSSRRSDYVEGPVIMLVNLMIQEAVTLRATEICIEPAGDRLVVYYRIDGQMVKRDDPPRRLLYVIVACFRNMAAMENNKGKILAVVYGHSYELHVSIEPTAHGPQLTATIMQVPSDS